MAHVLKMNPSSLPKTVILCTRKEMVSSVYHFLYHASQTEQTKKAVYDEFSKTSSKNLVPHINFGIWNGMYL